MVNAKLLINKTKYKIVKIIFFKINKLYVKIVYNNII